MNSLRLLNNLLLTLVSIAYPIIWLYAGQEEPILYLLPYLLGGLWLVKGCLQAVGWQRYFAIVISLVLFAIGVGRSLGSMYWYPVIMNGLMLAIFGGSLFTSQSFVERLARLQTPDLPIKAIVYTRKVTQVWCGLFLINILITTGLILTEQYEYWAIYSGVIAYILIGLTMSIEWCIRQIVIKKQSKSE